MWVAIVIIVAIVFFIGAGVAYMVWERRADASGTVHEEGEHGEEEAPVDPRLQHDESQGGEPGLGDPPSQLGPEQER